MRKRNQTHKPEPLQGSDLLTHGIATDDATGKLCKEVIRKIKATLDKGTNCSVIAWGE